MGVVRLFSREGGGEQEHTLCQKKPYYTIFLKKVQKQTIFGRLYLQFISNCYLELCNTSHKPDLKIFTHDITYGHIFLSDNPT